jgi:uncharacterized protein (TIGR02118 family)
VVKLVYCVCRKPGMSREAFLRYWAEVHAPLGARIPGLRRLVHSYALAVPEDSRPADFDGMAELWFDDPAAIVAARRSAAWAAATADEANFLDGSRSAYFVSQEPRVVLPAAGI